MNDKANKLSKVWDETQGATVAFTLGTWTDTLNVDGLAENIKLALMLHGAAQKVGDAAAGKSGGEAVAAMLKVLDSLRAGNWSRGRESGGPRVTIFVRALAKVFGAEITDEFLAKVEGMEDERKAQVKAHPKYKRALAEVKAEDAAAALAAASAGTEEESELTLG